MSAENAMDWRGFIEANKSMQRHEALLLDAENFLSALGEKYGLTIAVPPILLSPCLDFNALATEDDKIHLNVGVFNKGEIFADLAMIGSPSHGRKDLAHFKMRLIILWVIAHEFFHIAHSHYSVFKEHGPSSRKPIEFDADMMAVAGLYRWLSIERKDLQPMQIKAIIIDSIFWPMRAHIGSAFADPHHVDQMYPTWHLRIWTAYTKLIQLDNDGNWTSKMPIKAEEELDFLGKLVADCDTVYCRNFSLPRSTFADFLHTKRNVSDYNPLYESWEKIQDSVIRLKRLKFG